MQRLGKYEIKRILGRGAMGVVYEGFDPVIARRVAIKTVRIPDPDDIEAIEDLARFQREAQAAGRLSHPNIVGVFDTGESDGVAYIVMEFVAGTTLKSFLDRGDRFTVPDVVRIMTELLAGLGYSHANGVIHRDIKPANVMMTDSGQIKLADFGVARIESSSMTQAGTMIGTPSYMSPEQFMGQTVDARTDLYSCGVLLYQLLTGEKPFEGSVTSVMHKVLNTEPPAPSILSVTVPAALDSVVAKAMAKRPEDRFASAKAFGEALKQAMVPAALLQRNMVTPDSQFDDCSDATMVTSNPTMRSLPGSIGSSSGPQTVSPIEPVRSGNKRVLMIGGAVSTLIAFGIVLFIFFRQSPSTAHHKTPVKAAPLVPVTPQISSAAKATMLKTMTKAKIVELIGPALCSLVHAHFGRSSVTLTGIADTADDADIFARVKSIPQPTHVKISRFDGPYCKLLTKVSYYKGTILPSADQVHVGLVTGKAVLKTGQTIGLHLSIPAYARFLEIDYVSSNGLVYHLPTPKTLNLFIAPDIGTLPLGHVGPPYGTDMILVIASAQPLFAIARPAQESAKHFAAALGKALDQMPDNNGLTVGATLVRTAMSKSVHSQP